MKLNRPVRIIRRDQTERSEEPAKKAGSAEAPPSERQLQTVVSGWVSEHRRRSEEFRNNYSKMLRRAGFLLPRAPSRA